jgi:hypothetical protein
MAKQQNRYTVVQLGPRSWTVVDQTTGRSVSNTSTSLPWHFIGRASARKAARDLNRPRLDAREFRVLVHHDLVREYLVRAADPEAAADLATAAAHRLGHAASASTPNRKLNGVRLGQVTEHWDHTEAAVELPRTVMNTVFPKTPEYKPCHCGNWGHTSHQATNTVCPRNVPLKGAR